MGGTQASVWDDGCLGLPGRGTSILWQVLQREDDLMEPLAGRTSPPGLSVHDQSEVKGRVKGWTREKTTERWVELGHR